MLPQTLSPESDFSKIDLDQRPFSPINGKASKFVFSFFVELSNLPNIDVKS